MNACACCLNNEPALGSTWCDTCTANEPGSFDEPSIRPEVRMLFHSSIIDTAQPPSGRDVVRYRSTRVYDKLAELAALYARNIRPGDDVGQRRVTNQAFNIELNDLRNFLLWSTGCSLFEWVTSSDSERLEMLEGIEKLLIKCEQDPECY